MIRYKISETLNKALENASPALNDIALDRVALADVLGRIKIERPKQKDHGDYAVNISPLSSLAKLGPPQIAQILEKELAHCVDLEASTIAGFVNFRINTLLMAQALLNTLTTKVPGKNDSLKSDTILLEYVSANPTGPLHIGHGRWAALGDSLVRIWRHCGATVTPEFYINNAGVQTFKIGYSIYLRAVEQILTANGMGIPDDMEAPPYPGDYVKELASQYLSQPKSKEDILALCEKHLQVFEGVLTSDDFQVFIQPHIEKISAFAVETFSAQQKALLETMGVHFEAWFREKEMLHDRGLVDEIVSRLKHDGFCYEQDGALWLQSSDFEDEKDRVLKKSDGSYTYLAPDVAYHHQKFSRADADEQPQYNRIINIWGADHHGYIIRMKAALTALGHLKDMDDPRFEVILGQLVNLIVDGEKERMGKRRKMLTLADVIDEVGVDATRFWMVSKSADTALDFDVDLAQAETHENPVYYAQYAHARCASILRNAVEPTPTEENPKPTPFISFEALDELSDSPSIEDLTPLFNVLEEGSEDSNAFEHLKSLILRLDAFEDSLKEAAKTSSPHIVARYALDLAADFHSFYNVCRILTDNSVITRARLALILSIKKTLAQALELLGVSAPDSM